MSLEFQNIMYIVIETLFQWDTNKREAKGKCIFRRVVACASAYEEQGRKALHHHIQQLAEEANQKLRRGE